jgi:hypothetical protein
MILKRTVILFASFVLLLSCGKKQTSISIDDWWDVDVAKSGCAMRAGVGNPCLSDPVADVRNFEMVIAGAVAGDPVCHGVTMSNATASPDWQLMVDFVEGSETRSWTLVRHPDGTTITGRGSASEIAHSACMVATGRGGRVTN